MHRGLALDRLCRLLPDSAARRHLALVADRIPRLAGAAPSLWLPLAAQGRGRMHVRSRHHPASHDRHPVIKSANRPRCSRTVRAAGQGCGSAVVASGAPEAGRACQNEGADGQHPGVLGSEQVESGAARREDAREGEQRRCWSCGAAEAQHSAPGEAR